MGCTPSAFEVAYGTGVAVASRDSEPALVTETASDRKIAIDIDRAWLDASLTRFSDLDTTVDNGMVTVSGTTTSRDDHIEALRIVWEQPGVAAVHSTVSSGAPEADLLLAEAIRLRLSSDPSVHKEKFTVEVVGNNVYVLGRARSQAELDRVIRHARSVGDVRRIVSMVLVNRTGA